MSEEQEVIPMTAFRNILVAIDFSEHSGRALDVAIELGKQFSGRLHLIHAYPIQPIMMAPYEMPLPQSFERECRAAADKQLSSWADRARKAGLPVETTTSAEHPSEAIVHCAEKIGADLIVMGTRGFTGLKHVLLGSIAERTLRFAPCPVLTLKAS
jgi:nucleotide-binding universal stress UspA family protein